jgi:inorganic pyrophosphatase
MVDAGQADDKIVAVLDADVAFGELHELSQCPAGLLARLKHYFLTYKQWPADTPRKAVIPEAYPRAEALEVIQLSREDYRAKFGAPEGRLEHLKALLGR